MKKVKTVLAIVLLTLSGITVSAQTDTIKIKTSAICDQCKERIEHDLSFEKGIKSARLDLDTKEVTVYYNTQKTDAEKIRIAITHIGYDADTLKADAKAFNHLPDCCKKK